MFRRLGVLACAAAMGAAAVLTAGTAAAQQCPDVHWIGAAGSGERGAEATLNDGMGRVVYSSLVDFQRSLQSDGRTLTAEAVDYPAVPVPVDDSIMGWAGFMHSVDTGAEALGQQYQSFVAACPNSKVVLAGYSQGAMVVHRNLAALADSPNLAAVLLVADGDRRPEDPTVDLGSVSTVPGAGKGVAQDWPILAHAPAPLPPMVASRTVDVCNLGDAVCDYDPDAEDAMNPTAVAIHTSYATGSNGGYAWTAPLYRLLGSAPVARDVTLTAAGS
jgi:hypothetical protein